MMMLYMAALVGIYFLHLLLKLNWWITAILAIAAFPLVRLHRKFYRQGKEAEEEFHEACIYMDTVLYAFAKSEKIDSALTDAAGTVKEGKLKETLQKAIDHFYVTFDESEITKDALSIITEVYDCKRIRNIHDFMLHAEYYGGDISQSVSLLLEDKKRWQGRIDSHILERHKNLREIILSVVASLVICSCILYLPAFRMDISANWLIQIISLVLLLLDEVIILRGQKFLQADYLNLDSFESEADGKEKLEEFRAYDPKKASRLSLVLGIVAGLITVLFFVLKNNWAFACGLALCLVFLNQHRIGHAVSRKGLRKQMQAAFPSYLVDLALLMQSENVQVSIGKSLEHAPAILQKDLSNLRDDLLVDPESSAPYHKFLKEFEIPQISSAMSMLYTIASGNGRSGKDQLRELIENNYELLDETEKIRLKDKCSGMYLLFLAPVLTASFKLLADMAIFMLSFISYGIGGI